MEARALVLLVWLTKEAPGRPQSCCLGISWSMASRNESPFSVVSLDLKACWGSVLSGPLSMELAEGRRKDGIAERKQGHLSSPSL